MKANQRNFSNVFTIAFDGVFYTSGTVPSNNPQRETKVTEMNAETQIMSGCQSGCTLNY